MSDQPSDPSGSTSGPPRSASQGGGHWTRSSPRVWLGRGPARLQTARAHAAAFEAASAAAAFDQVLQIDPTNAEALIGLSRASNDLGREAGRAEDEGHLETALRHALRLQQQIRDLRPRGRDPPVVRAGPWPTASWAVCRGGSLEESARKIEKAVALDPDCVYHRYELGLTYEKMKRLQEATEQLRLAFSLPVREAQEPAAQADAREGLARLPAVGLPNRGNRLHRSTTLHNLGTLGPKAALFTSRPKEKGRPSRGQRARHGEVEGEACA